MATTATEVNAPPAETARPADRCIMTIFGASGDLTRRKLLPALYNLGLKNLLPREFAILGFAIDQIGEEDVRGIRTDDFFMKAGGIQTIQQSIHDHESAAQDQKDWSTESSSQGPDSDMEDAQAFQKS